MNDTPHGNGACAKLGDRVQVWKGARPGRSTEATVIDSGIIGGRSCYRVQFDDGTTDYIAITHAEVIPYDAVAAQSSVPGSSQ